MNSKLNFDNTVTAIAIQEAKNVSEDIQVCGTDYTKDEDMAINRNIVITIASSFKGDDSCYDIAFIVPIEICSDNIHAANHFLFFYFLW